MDEEPTWRAWLPYMALSLSLTILFFQIFVLHGWHIRLSNQMAHLTRKVSA